MIGIYKGKTPRDLFDCAWCKKVRSIRHRIFGHPQPGEYIEVCEGCYFTGRTPSSEQVRP